MNFLWQTDILYYKKILFNFLQNMYLKSIKSNMFIINLNIFSVEKHYVTPKSHFKLLSVNGENSHKAK